MRLSSLLGKTLRQPPSDAHLISHQLLVRAGYLRTVETGHFAYLPLGQRTMERLHALARHELARQGGQEIDVPAPPDADPDTTLVRLVRREVDSYRQLPLLLCHMLTRAVSEPTSRAGLFGASERPYVEIHAFGPADMAGGDDLAITGQVRAAIDGVLASCSLPTVWAGVGDKGSRAYYGHPSGDDNLVRCPACGYAEERSWATTRWPQPRDETELPTEEIATPGCDTIASLAEFLQIPASQTLKMVFYSVEGKVNCVVIRGDRAVDETKLARVLGTDWYYASLEEELEAVGAVGGYASPIGLDRSRVRVMADPSVRSGRNFVSGANRPDFHIQNVNIPRDFAPGEWADLALVEPGDPCPECSFPLEIEPAFALAQSSPPKPCQPEAEYLDSGGRSRPLWMASWQLDLGRVMAAVIEGHHDDYGIVWPASCAPFDAHLVGLDLQKESVGAQAEALYDRLQAEGITVLFDDRNASAGVKFNDADLIGIPLRLTVSKRSAKEGLIEAKWRGAAERLKLNDDGLAAALSRLRGA
jgi:prolyl-tRNA synthetase